MNLALASHAFGTASNASPNIAQARGQSGSRTKGVGYLLSSWLRFDEFAGYRLTGGTTMRRVWCLAWVICLIVTRSGAFAAELTRADVQSMLSSAPAAQGANFSGRSLAGLDLRDLDFSNANLSGANLSDADLRGAKLVAAKLVAANLTRAQLNLAWIMRADFSRADLSNADLETLVVSAGMETRPQEAASFVGANLSGAKVMARFTLDDMRGADLSGLRASADMRNQSMGLIRADFSQANLVGANFKGASLAYAAFEFAKLANADFSGADLTHVDFAGADLTDANFTGAKTVGASFASATLGGAKGLAIAPNR